MLETIDVLRRCQQLFKEALPKFNWGASALDANAIQLLNEVPAEVDRKLDGLLAEANRERAINCYTVEISDGRGIVEGKNKFECKQLRVLAENDTYLVVNDHRFTSVKKEYSDYQTCLDAPSISMYNGDNVFGSGVSYTLYTERNVRATTIRKEIEKAVVKKYGFFINGLKLDFIKDQK